MIDNAIIDERGGPQKKRHARATAKSEQDWQLDRSQATRGDDGGGGRRGEAKRTANQQTEADGSAAAGGGATRC